MLNLTYRRHGAEEVMPKTTVTDDGSSPIFGKLDPMSILNLLMRDDKSSEIIQQWHSQMT